MKTAASLNSARLFPWFVFLVALILRLLPVLWGKDLGIGLDDMFQYDMLARSIASGQGFRWYAQPDLKQIQPYLPVDLAATPGYDPRGVVTAFRAPLYPAFLALIYKLAGLGTGRFLAARLGQAVLGAILAPLTYFASLGFLEGDYRSARYAAWAIAFYPILIIFPLALATENLFFVLLLASAVALLSAERKPTARAFAIAGLLFGLTALSRSITLPAAALAILWVWFALREQRGALIMGAAVVLVASPWLIRNEVLFSRPTIELSMGYNLYMGYHPKSTGDFQYGISLDLMNTLNDGLRDREGTMMAEQFIARDPGRVPYLMLRKLGYFWSLERRGLTYFYSNDFFGYVALPWLVTAAMILLVPFVVVCVSASLGLALVAWDRRIVLLALLIFGYMLPHILILSEDRFHLALVPFLAVMAAQFWSRGWRSVTTRWSGTRVARVALILAGAAILLLCLNWGVELHRDAGKLALLFSPGGNTTHFTY
jgi:hypothetical protein